MHRSPMVCVSTTTTFEMYACISNCDPPGRTCMQCFCKISLHLQCPGPEWVSNQCVKSSTACAQLALIMKSDMLSCLAGLAMLGKHFAVTS